jgi:hypothetical protein
MTMAKRDYESHEAEAVPTPVLPLPIALYDSNGLLFELYEGGQPYRLFAIRWETLKPIRVTDESVGNALQSSMHSQR